MDGPIAALSQSLDSWLSPRFLFPTLLLVGGVVGGLIGWWLRVSRERTRRRNSDAFESEVVRAAGRARERARQEKALLEERVTKLQDELKQSGDKNDLLERQLRDAAATIERLSGKLSAAQASAAPRSAEPSPRTAEAPRPDNPQPDKAPPWLTKSGDGKDDLQAIRGLGPVIERRLNELGICQYRQLAQLTAENVGWVASKIQVVPGRIKRDQWANQARRMHQLKYKERL